MLRDRYEPNPQFWALTEQLALKMEPQISQIDMILEDDDVFTLMRDDLSQRYPQTLITGRNSTPVESILRMLALKHLYDWTYRETVWHVGDSLVLRAFCRLYFEPVPDHTTLNRWALLVTPETLVAFNQRVSTIAESCKVTRGRKLRTDGTVVETNIAYPTDSKLLADSVRVLSRTIMRAKGVVADMTAQTATTFRNRTRSAQNQARTIARRARRKTEQARQAIQQAYRRLVKITQTNLEQAKSVVKLLNTEGSLEAHGLVQTLKTFIPRAEQVITQTVRRVFHSKSVPASEKLVSIFEPHTTIIRRGKAGKATEFGRKVWLDEVDGGIVTRWKVLNGNPPDDEQWRPALDHHIERFGNPPWHTLRVSADRGVYSPDNEAYADRVGVKRAILPKPGRKSDTRRRYEAQGWFKRGRRFHAGIEGRISVSKRKHGLDRCRDHGEIGFDKWVGWGVIANNLTVMGTALAAKAHKFA